MKVILSLPPSTNQTYRHHGHTVYMTQEAKSWQIEALWTLKVSIKPLSDPTNVTITYYLKRDRDVDGSHKIIIDCLQKAGIVSNDKVLTELHLYKKIEKVNPRVEVEW